MILSKPKQLPKAAPHRHYLFQRPKNIKPKTSSSNKPFNINSTVRLLQSAWISPKQLAIYFNLKGEETRRFHIDHARFPETNTLCFRFHYQQQVCWKSILPGSFHTHISVNVRKGDNSTNKQKETQILYLVLQKQISNYTTGYFPGPSRHLVYFQWHHGCMF